MSKLFDSAASITRIKAMGSDLEQAAVACREWAAEIAPDFIRDDRNGRQATGERTRILHHRADLLRSLAQTFKQEAQITRETLALIEL